MGDPLVGGLSPQPLRHSRFLDAAEWDPLMATTTCVHPTGEVTTIVASPMRRRGGSSPQQVVCTTRLPPAGSLAAELKGLAELRSDGRITDEEYDICKRAVIARYQLPERSGSGEVFQFTPARESRASATPEEGRALLPTSDPSPCADEDPNPPSGYVPDAQPIIHASEGRGYSSPPAAERGDSALTVAADRPSTHSSPRFAEAASVPIEAEGGAEPAVDSYLVSSSPGIARPEPAVISSSNQLPAATPPPNPTPTFPPPNPFPVFASPPDPAPPVYSSGPVPVYQPSPRLIPLSISAHLYGSVVTVFSDFPSSSGLEALKLVVEELLLKEARGRCPGGHVISDSVWVAAVKVKQLQIHGTSGWTDLLGTTQLLAYDNCHIFAQLTTAGKRPRRGDVVMLSPGHAPELLSTGCLQPGEEGVVEIDPPRDDDTAPVTVAGPRGDSFVYFREDLITVREGAVQPLGECTVANRLIFEAGGVPKSEGTKSPVHSAQPTPQTAVVESPEQEISRLIEMKEKAAAEEDYETAKKLKSYIDSLQRAPERQPPSYEAEIAELQAMKADAIAREDYEEAQHYKERIEALLALPPPAPSRDDEVKSLQDQLRRGMSHISASRELLDVATNLHDISPEAVYTVISEFQPTLSLTKIARNWRKILEIYQSHAEQAQLAYPEAEVAERSVMDSPHSSPDRYTDTGYQPDLLAAQLKGVINFIESPLSPRTLKEVRQIRKGYCSPLRD